MRAARSALSRIVLSALAALAACVCLRMPAHAQVDLYSLEAAYIYNFTEFTDWPGAHASASILTVCVEPRTELGAALGKLDGRAVSGKTWSVKPIPDSAAVGACNVLIVDGAASSAAAKSPSARDAPMLIVRAADADAGDTPCIVMLTRDGDRLRFDIDNKEAARRRLGLSSKLLRLARNVI
jgi:hypothetical protein